MDYFEVLIPKGKNKNWYKQLDLAEMPLSLRLLCSPKQFSLCVICLRRF